MSFTLSARIFRSHCKRKHGSGLLYNEAQQSLLRCTKRKAFCSVSDPGPTWLSSACVSLSLILYFTTSPFICWLWVCSVLIRCRISLLMGPGEKEKGKSARKGGTRGCTGSAVQLLCEVEDIYFHLLLKLPACSLAASVCSNSMRSISYSFLTCASVSSS